uniref:Uncharacterized protein n=1 Tax=Strigamia maritima TaxID=126957 RepID=T1IZJ0_STRMM
MDTNMPKFHLMSELPARRPSCTELSEIFFKSGYEGPYYNLTQQNLETIITACCEQQKLHLPGCASVTDKLFVHLCPVNTVQQNLRSLNIYDTSVSAPMAVCVFYSLPNLETFVYHDISGFLHYAGINIVKPDRRRIFRKRITKLQLGMIHDADIQLKYSNCHTGNFSELKEVELYLPAGNTKKSQADIFQFRRNKNGFYQFADIDKVITAMNPAKIFGGNTGIQLTEMSLDSVRDIKLDKTFSTLQFLKKMLLRSCSTKISYLMEVSPHLVQPDMDYHISRSVETLGLCNMTKDDV